MHKQVSYEELLAFINPHPFLTYACTVGSFSESLFSFLDVLNYLNKGDVDELIFPEFFCEFLIQRD